MRKDLFSIVLLLAAILYYGCKDVASPTIDKQNPTISLNVPGNASSATDTIVISATASDDVGVVKVEFYIDGSLSYTCSSTPWQFIWSLNGIIANSTHLIEAKAYDQARNIGSASTSLRVRSNGALYLSTISGTVVRDDNNQPLTNAVISELGSLANSDTTDTNGFFTLRFLLPVTYNTQIVTKCPGYFNDSILVVVHAGENKIVNIHLKK